MTFVLAVDAMGGDNAPGKVIRGVAIAAHRYPDVNFILFGPQEKLEPLVKRETHLDGRVEFVHTDEIVLPETKPSVAIRRMPKSSMRLAIQSVAKGEAQGVISAGNTGAYMALAKMILKTMPGIDRPALASLIPTLRSESILLDLGANIECSSKNLFQFAIMGEMFARYVLHLPKPTVGLLNVGTEDMKGSASVKEASDLLQESAIQKNFAGFVEGNDIPRGKVDVVVTDGFTGNAVLKLGEGMMHLALHYFRHAFKSSFMARLGYIFARPMLKKMNQRLDYRRYNGAVWLGLNGVAIKSHGGTDALGFAHAIDMAVDMLSSRVNDHIKAEFSHEVLAEDVKGAV